MYPKMKNVKCKTHQCIYIQQEHCVIRMISSCHQSMQKIGHVIAKDYHNLILYNLLTIE